MRSGEECFHFQFIQCRTERIQLGGQLGGVGIGVILHRRQLSHRTRIFQPFSSCHPRSQALFQHIQALHLCLRPGGIIPELRPTRRFFQRLNLRAAGFQVERLAQRFQPTPHISNCFDDFFEHFVPSLGTVYLMAVRLRDLTGECQSFRLKKGPHTIKTLSPVRVSPVRVGGDFDFLSTGV